MNAGERWLPSLGRFVRRWVKRARCDRGHALVGTRRYYREQKIGRERSFFSRPPGLFVEGFPNCLVGRPAQLTVVLPPPWSPWVAFRASPAASAAAPVLWTVG